jgi:SAM-dependent methyltransferase
VLDHLPDPLDTLKLILETLKPGGSICIAVHNVKSISATLLRSKSPIFDVEHTYLYSKKTLKLLLEKAGYSEIEIRHYKNSYSLAYLFHLLPLSRRFKSKLLNSNYGQLLRRVRLTVPLGNMWAVARKL